MISAGLRVASFPSGATCRGCVCQPIVRLRLGASARRLERQQPRCLRTHQTNDGFARRQCRPGKLHSMAPSRVPSLEFPGNLSANDERWVARYRQLVAFMEDEGHCEVPFHHGSDQSFGYWVQSQRKLQKQGKLRPDRFDMLEALGFIWDAREARWARWRSQLVEFRDAHGHCDVPIHFEANPQLARWVSAQRQALRKGKLSRERYERLEEDGFLWGIFVPWEHMYEVLLQYKEANGHCRVPQNYPANPELASWVKNQRKAYTAGELPEERLVMLKEAGFVFEAISSSWKAMFRRLRDFRETHGHCHVRLTEKEDPKLGRWVQRQRAAYKSGSLPKEKAVLMESSGFLWDGRAASRERRYDCSLLSTDH